MWPSTLSQAVDIIQCALGHRKLVGLAILKKPVLNIPRSTHYLRFPQFLDHAISVSSALAGRLPELTNVVSMQVALECLAHDWNLNPRVVPAIYWSFIHVPAHLLMALIVSLVAFASILAGRGECQCTSVGFVYLVVSCVLFCVFLLLISTSDTLGCCAIVSLPWCC